MTGYGGTENPKNDTNFIPSPVLRKITLQIMTQEKCKQMNPNMVTEQFICGSNVERKGICEGDSGGPISIYDPKKGKHVVVGLTSFLIGKCGEPGLPSYFTKFSRYIQWIRDIINLLKTEFVLDYKLCD